MKFSLSLLALVAILASPLTAGADDIPEEQELVVTATAYNSVEEQTDDDPDRGAWGDPLQPGMKAIAVSHDLIPLGLERGAPVRIEGLKGEYVVLDKMSSRWNKRIDIYMGEDVEAAIQWGRRSVRIRW